MTAEDLQRQLTTEHANHGAPAHELERAEA